MRVLRIPPSLSRFLELLLRQVVARLSRLVWHVLSFFKLALHPLEILLPAMHLKLELLQRWRVFSTALAISINLHAGSIVGCFLWVAGAIELFFKAVDLLLFLTITCLFRSLSQFAQFFVQRVFAAGFGMTTSVGCSFSFALALAPFQHFHLVLPHLLPLGYL